MNYKSNLSMNRYRVRLFTGAPNHEKFDEYFVSDMASGAWRQAIDKYGRGHKAIVLDWEPV